VQRWAVTKARMARRGGGIGERSRDREESVGVSMMRNVAADTKHTYIFEPIYGFTCLKVVLVGGPHAALPHASAGTQFSPLPCCIPDHAMNEVSFLRLMRARRFLVLTMMPLTKRC
jgi:hypothetical protein